MAPQQIHLGSQNLDSFAFKYLAAVSMTMIHLCRKFTPKPSCLLPHPLGSHLFLGSELEVDEAEKPQAHKNGHGTAEHNDRLAQDRRHRVVVGDGEITVSEVIDQVATLDDEGCTADGIQEGLVNLHAGFGDRGLGDSGGPLDVPAQNKVSNMLG